jgi:prepilin-type N-terminal cleavage/methylation domain-containing protein
MANPAPKMISGIGNNIRCPVLGARCSARTENRKPKTELAFTPLETIGRRKKAMVSLTGFTLIELMISVVILGVGLVVVIQSFLSSARGLNTTQNYIEALRVAQDKFSELELSSYENKGLLPDLDSKSGAGFLGPREFNWVSKVKEITEPDYLTEKLVEVCVNLNWKERNVSRDVSLATYLPREKE